MSDLVEHSANGSEDLIRVLQNSLYPGAKRESVELVVAYCRLNQLDPMLKPVHIVPTNVKVGPDQWEIRDTLMPGIGLYRILAARSGHYGGKSEPEFGPVQTEKLGDITVVFPEWCRVTISRIVQGHARTFTATERWMENYATAGRKTDAPNTMWRKRAFGQLAKCAEAQALRMAFPEFSGAAPTVEEMEGKDSFIGTTLDATPEPLRAAAAPTPRAERVVDPTVYDTPPKPKPQRTPEQLLDGLEIAMRDCGSLAEVNKLIANRHVQDMLRDYKNGHKARLDGIIAAGIGAHAPVTHDTDAWPGADVDSAAEPAHA